MERELVLILQALLVAVLVPVLLAAALTTSWGRRRGRSGRVALYGAMSCLGAILTSGWPSSGDPRPILSMIQAAREAPPEVLQRELPPHLARTLMALAHRSGRPTTPEEIQHQVHRIMHKLLEFRSLPPDRIEGRLPELVRELASSAGSPGPLELLTWTSYTDAALGVVMAAGVEAGPVVGALAGLAGAGFRGLAGGIPAPFLLPTILVGLLAGLAGRSRPGRWWGGRGGFVLGFALGIGQLAWALVLAPAGVLSPGLILSGATVALLHGTGLGLFLTVLRVARLEEEERRSREGEVRSRLALLTAQIRPHFLFNALNTLSASSETDPGRTRHLIDCLARFLRLSLRPAPRLVTLERELEDLEAYLELERARFTDRLEIRVDCEPAARSARVPPLLLQPLVENALVHGFREGGETLHIRLGARIRDDRLVIEVADDGRGVSPLKRADLGRGDGLGIGLGSVMERAASLVPPATVTLGHAEPTGLWITVAIPLAAELPSGTRPVAGTAPDREPGGTR